MRARTAVELIVSLALLCLSLVGNLAGQEVLPRPEPPFHGQIGLSIKDSKPYFPKPIQAPKGAPNIVLVLLDDVGFGAASTFGGPCETPTLERLAKSGLRYTQFHTTALCSPTRAALLTGCNHHSVHTGTIMEMATGFPGYDSLMGKDTATVAEILKQKGWNTAWFGKNHNVPDWQSSQAGPFDLWPTGLGFEHFYGFIGGETSQWRPAVFDGTRPIEPYLGNSDYNFDYDMADQAILWVRNQQTIAPGRPFLLYYAPGATHSPHHPKKEWIAKYKGQFDQGWDKMREETLARQKELGLVPANTRLTKRHTGIPAWDSLKPEQKQLYAYMMEIYAGFLEQTDYNIGRVLDAIEKLGQLDNTLVIYLVGDNGASAEGGPGGLLNELTSLNGLFEDEKQTLQRKDDLGTWKTHNHYPYGWAHAMDTPFQWTKQIASHYGGTRNAMVISWPARIKDRGGIRSQWHHTIDIVPTILDVCGMQAPSVVNGVTQKPIEGVSMAYSFDNAKSPPARHTQYFEMFGNRAIYHDGWLACTTPKSAPWEDVTIVPEAAKQDVIIGSKWELYHVTEDFSQAANVADQNPDKLRELQLLFYAEAARYNVLPIDDSKIERFNVSVRPSLTRSRSEFTYYQGQKRIPEGAAPDIKNKSFRITAEVMLAKGDEQGVVLTQGGLFGGYALLFQAGKPVFHYNLANMAHFNIAAKDALAPGQHTIVFDFQYDGGGYGKGGTGTLNVDGKQIAQGRIAGTVPMRITFDETLDVGEDTGTGVSEDYDMPFKFTGKIGKVIVTLGETKMSAVDQKAMQEMAGGKPARSTEPKDAEPATQQANATVLKELNFADRKDFEDAQRGLIAGPASAVIRDSDGKEVWNLQAYDFLKQKDAPATVNPSLWRQDRLNMNAGLFKVVDRIYQVCGLDLSNMTIVEGDKGVILIDPLISAETARAALDLYYQHREKRPIVAVIYTHSHVDHFGGVKGVVDDADVKAGNIRIFAPERFLEAATSENLTAGTVMGRRSDYWYGIVLPRGERGQVDAGIGKASSIGRTTLIAPTDIITKTGEKRIIDGVEMIFHMAPDTEVPAEMMIFFPQFKVFNSTELACHTLHNVLTLRGAQVRDAYKWALYLNEAIAMYGDQIEILIAQHNWPRWGHDRAIKFLKDQRDMYKYIHDQALRLANKGYTMSEIGPMLKLPSSLSRKWYARDYYGTVNHNAKAVYQKYLGWYDMNPANLNPLPPKELAKNYIRYMGGAKAVIAKARADFKKGEYRWVAQAINHVVFADPNNKEARNLQADVLEQLGYQAEAFTWRNNYLTAAYELRNGVHTVSRGAGSLDVITAMTIPMFFDFMGVQLNGPKADGKVIILNWNFTDVGEKYVLNLENSALTYMPNRQDPKLTLQLHLPGQCLMQSLWKKQHSKRRLHPEI